ncbi:hypothetical protein PR048_006361 [Dryococelus australis]|uniref:Uncharacterized protein n=1 Tax=Dryococelus australis TaxID=614101 RepID=A0ABQ9IAU5_9NEOP|nr:hypothetical protein PR048_006361 [Dryococelus australis]
MLSVWCVQRQQCHVVSLPPAAGAKIIFAFELYNGNDACHLRNLRLDAPGRQVSESISHSNSLIHFCASNGRNSSTTPGILKFMVQDQSKNTAANQTSTSKSQFDWGGGIVEGEKVEGEMLWNSSIFVGRQSNNRDMRRVCDDSEARAAGRVNSGIVYSRKIASGDSVFSNQAEASSLQPLSFVLITRDHLKPLTGRPAIEARSNEPAAIQLVSSVRRTEEGLGKKKKKQTINHHYTGKSRGFSHWEETSVIMALVMDTQCKIILTTIRFLDSSLGKIVVFRSRCQRKYITPQKRTELYFKVTTHAVNIILESYIRVKNCFFRLPYLKTH